jgi:hypothetical protein
MAIAEFFDTARYGRHQSWASRHGFAMALAGCLMFWTLVGTAACFVL